MGRLAGLLARTALLVSLLTLAARAVGFLRWLVFSPTVGAGVVGTAYQSANQVPNILFEVVAGGALAGAVVPLLAGPLAKADTRQVSRIASALLGWALLVTVPLAVAVVACARPLAAVLVPDPAATEVAAAFLVMFAVQLPFYGVGAVLTGVLQAHRRFLWPAFVPLLSSLVVIGTYLGYGMLPSGPDSSPPSSLALLGWGTTCGVLALSLPLVLPTRRVGVRLRPTLRFPAGVAVRARRLASAGVVALLVQQAAVLVTMLVANRVGGTGVYVVFSYIQAVYLLPYAVLVVPVVTIAFQQLSAQLAAAGAGQESVAEASRTVSRTTDRVLWLGLTGAVVLVCAAGPLEDFFTGIDRAAASSEVPFAAMASGVVLMALAVPGWCLVNWGQRIFFAHERSRFAAFGPVLGWVIVVLVALGGGAWVARANTVAATDSPGATLLVIAGAHALGMTIAGVLAVVLVRTVLGLGSLRRTGLVAVALLVCAALAVAASTGAAGVLGAVPGLPPLLGHVVRGILLALVGVAVMAVPVLLARRKNAPEDRPSAADSSVDFERDATGE
ncbi:murein biosynthesis integral membrane protein MurJ [Brevibacterium samyangense]|uniref:Lipid II flippase MurJ n=1 Tax=Brevibacterium samyangense TaxID=366888 RepID=A0ABP5EQQ7_9MICO